jgi:electron transfer flavoprotein beta subunit
MNEVARLRLPAVLQIQAGLNHPRYASLKGIMQAKKKEIADVSATDLGLETADVGAAGATVEILEVVFPQTGSGAEMIEGDPATAAAALVLKLQKEARVL